jgi:DNA-binding NarL/FixJ family response regulator
MPRTLSPLQRQIARALWSGAELMELSRRFSRSLYTIERQVADVYAAFEVRSRGELLEVAQTRGLA